ncbi:MFS transporter [Crossiella sp. CA198]|uniref:MFS transporter n=1 Tax=Crossiella sp. CA198 TaxID=3455607 RepID=UPI003F8D07EE
MTAAPARPSGRHRKPAPGRHRLRKDRRAGQYSVAQFAFGVNLVGNGIGGVGLPLFVLDSTHDIAFTGIIVTVAVISSIGTGLFMGPVIDRFGMRVSWIFSITIGSAITVLMYVLHLAGSLPPWLLLALCFVRAGADEPGRVATFGLLPALAESSGHSLERANATLRAMNAIATMSSPILVGGIVSLFGSSTILLIDAIAGLLAAVIVVFFLVNAVEQVPASDEPSEQDEFEGLSYRRRFAMAMKFFWGDKVLKVLIISTTVFAALDTGLASIGLTAYANEILGSVAWYGGLVGAFGLGSLAGTIGYGVLGPKLPRRGVYLTAYIGMAVMLLLLAWQTEVPIALAIMAIAGILTSPVDLLYMQALQERVPKPMFGGVTSIATTIVSGPSPIAVSLLTWLLATLGSHHTFVVIGSCYLLLALSLFLVRPLREL